MASRMLSSMAMATSSLANLPQTQKLEPSSRHYQPLWWVSRPSSSHSKPLVWVFHWSWIWSLLRVTPGLNLHLLFKNFNKFIAWVFIYCFKLHISELKCCFYYVIIFISLSFFLWYVNKLRLPNIMNVWTSDWLVIIHFDRKKYYTFFQRSREVICHTWVIQIASHTRCKSLSSIR